MNTGMISGPADLSSEYPELIDLVAGFGGERLELGTIFKERTGFRIKALNKKKILYLKLSQPVLKTMLLPGELIRYVSMGTLVWSVEMLVSGHWASYGNFTTIILTNQRFIFLNVDTKGKPRGMLYSQLKLSALKNISSGLLGGIKLNPVSGKARQFQGVNKRDAKNLKSLIEEISAGAAGMVSTGLESPGLEHLCPYCFSPVPDQTFLCQKCGTTFRTPKQAAIRSLILPGWGDFYLQNKVVGGMKMFGMGMVYLILLGSLFAEAPGKAMEVVIPLVFILILVSGLNALATLVIAKKGLVPLQKGTGLGATSHPIN